MDSHLILQIAAVIAIAGFMAFKLKHRLALSRAKHPALAGHSKMSRRLARLDPGSALILTKREFFRSDGAPQELAAKRRDGFFRLAGLYQQRFAQTRRMTSEASEGISDLQFTQSYRVPFQYSRLVRQHLGAGAFLQSSQGVTVTDLDGNNLFDLTGSYGVNVFGTDFYKECIASAEKRASALGPVLGPYHLGRGRKTWHGCAPSPGSMRFRSTCRGRKR